MTSINPILEKLASVGCYPVAAVDPKTGRGTPATDAPALDQLGRTDAGRIALIVEDGNRDRWILTAHPESGTCASAATYGTGARINELFSTNGEG